MGVRRDQPSQQGRSGSISLRLRDGSTVSVSVDDPRTEPETSGICCFCGEGVEYSDPRHLTLAARWSNQDREAQNWSAHDTCLADHMHDRVKGTGLFPDR